MIDEQAMLAAVRTVEPSASVVRWFNGSGCSIRMPRRLVSIDIFDFSRMPRVDIRMVKGRRDYALVRTVMDELDRQGPGERRSTPKEHV